MKITTAFREEIEQWRLNPEQRGLVMAFTYCLDLRMRGVDFQRHWDAMCGQDTVELEGRDYVL